MERVISLQGIPVSPKPTVCQCYRTGGYPREARIITCKQLFSLWLPITVEMNETKMKIFCDDFYASSQHDFLFFKNKRFIYLVRRFLRQYRGRNCEIRCFQTHRRTADDMSVGMVVSCCLSESNSMLKRRVNLSTWLSFRCFQNIFAVSRISSVAS